MAENHARVWTVSKLSWNGEQRTKEAGLLQERSEALLDGLPSGGGALAEPLDWLALGWRVDAWSAADAWEAFDSAAVE